MCLCYMTWIIDWEIRWRIVISLKMRMLTIETGTAMSRPISNVFFKMVLPLARWEKGIEID